MKKTLFKISLFACIVIFLTGCSKDEKLTSDIVGLGGDTWEKGPIDEWISTNYTNPYNIEVKYNGIVLN